MLINSLKRCIEAKKICLHHHDRPSILCWVERLQEAGDLLAFKSSSDPPPERSGLKAQTFVLVIQTNYQCSIFGCEGHNYAGIDATHNMTHYENTSLFTLLVCDCWGHGMYLTTIKIMEG